MMRQLLYQVIQRLTFYIDNTRLNDLSANSDVMEAYFNFNSLIAKKMPQALADEEINCDKLVEQGTQDQASTLAKQRQIC